ncbi:MAG: VWA domain-containing protein [Blastocatellia bacterium]|nr:VWA domain-containing protein [Blastocatellia bacterium]
MVNARVCFLLAVSLWTGQSASASKQTQKPKEDDQQLRLKADLLEVRAVVTDKSGRIIDDLKKEDFELLDKGKPQEISFFSLERTGGRDTVRKAPDSDKIVPPGVSEPAAKEPGARTVVLFVDTLHLSLSSLGLVRKALHRFVDEEMTNRDHVLLMTSTGMLGVLEQFTQDRKILRYAINKITPWKSQQESLFTPYLAAMVKKRLPDAFGVAVEVLKQEDPSLAFAPPAFLRHIVEQKASEVLINETYRRKDVLSSLKAIVERLARMPGQRLLFFMSDGFSLRDQGGEVDGSDMRRAINYAVRSGVVIYSLYAKGLVPPPLFSASMRVGVSGALGGRLMSFSSDGEKDDQDGMNALAADTGGQPFFRTNDLGGAIQKAIESNRVYYTLAYYPPDFKDDKKFRSIIVRVKGHPEYQVRAQRGYLPVDLEKEEKDIFGNTPQGKLFRAIASPLLTTDIGIMASAYYLETGSDNAQVSLRVHIDGDDFEYIEQNGRHRLELEVATVVYDRTGKAIDTHSDDVRGELLPERFEIARQTGYNYSRRLTLKPGLYHIRVGVREAESERVGTAKAWVDVPKPDKNRLMMSDILLAEPTTADLPASGAAASKGLLVARQEGGIKFYKVGSTLIYYLMAYNAASKKSAESDVLIQSEILHSDRVIYQSEWHPLDSRLMGRDKKGVEIGGQIKLAIAPGIYELRITLKDEKAKRSAQKSIPFGIEP